MEKKKRLILLLIILFPSAFWLILETSTINSKKLPFYGPKSLNGKDTLYYSMGNLDLPCLTNNSITLKYFDTVNYPLITLSFIKPNYITENFRLAGLTDYTQHKIDEIKHLPLLLVFPKPDSLNKVSYNLKDTLQIPLNTIEQCYWNASSYDSMNVSFFYKKPVHIDYSFIVLLDKKRRIRGYYDGRYSAEMKRLLQEYQHLRIKEEKNTMLRENEIKDEKNK